MKPHSKPQRSSVREFKGLLSVIELLSDLGICGAIVGGLAVGIRTVPRFTKDADIAVAVDSEAQIDDLMRALFAAGHKQGQMLFAENSNELITARLILANSNSEQPDLDLLFATSRIESEVARSAERLRLTPKVSIPVARAGHLIAMKMLARQRKTREAQDTADIFRLFEVCDEQEMILALESTELIMQRGRAREIDLLGQLKELIKLWKEDQLAPLPKPRAKK